jgi:hypothetical protein
MCRKLGVDSIKVDGVELHLGAIPTKAPKASKQAAPEFAFTGITEDTRIPSDVMTDEQMLFWSSANADSEQQS